MAAILQNGSKEERHLCIFFVISTICKQTHLRQEIRFFFVARRICIINRRQSSEDKIRRFVQNCTDRMIWSFVYTEVNINHQTGKTIEQKIRYNKKPFGHIWTFQFSCCAVFTHASNFNSVYTDFSALFIIINQTLVHIFKISNCVVMRTSTSNYVTAINLPCVMWHNLFSTDIQSKKD